MAKEKEKSKESLGSFTVGSTAGGRSKANVAPKAAKAEKRVTVEIKESVFPILANLRRGGGKEAKALQEEMQRVLLAASEIAKKGSEKEKKDAEQVQKAYALSLALLESSKIVR